MENTQTVSVVATVLNEVAEIDVLLSSLAHQSLVPAEIIIVDGGSTDGTWERLQAARAIYANLSPIRDESCRLPNSRGPIARGRNIAIAAASSRVIACVDAGCTYASDWLQRISDPILNGQSEYSLGGSCIDPEDRTVWDVASAPFLGVKLSRDAKTKSCTARSMAFSKQAWQRVGGFPEDILLGEDTVFDLKMRSMLAPAFPQRAKAIYRPRNTLNSALSQIARYSISDGVAGVRPARLARNLSRCVIELIAMVALFKTPIPLICVLALEIFFAFRLDWKSLRGASPKALAARMFFSLLVPWVVTWNQIKGAITKANPLNRQNLGIRSRRVP